MCRRVGGLWETIWLVAHEKQMSSFVRRCLSKTHIHYGWYIPQKVAKECEPNGRQKTLVLNDTCGSPYSLSFTNAPHSVGLFPLLPSLLPSLKSALTFIQICRYGYSEIRQSVPEVTWNMSGQGPGWSYFLILYMLINYNPDKTQRATHGGAHTGRVCVQGLELSVIPHVLILTYS